MPYAELHAHSSYSFLDGASSPEELLEEAERLGLHALAITDHDGFYGIVRFAEAAETAQVKTVFGAELSLGLTEPQNGEADPEGTHLLVLARGQEGYHRLAARDHRGAAARGREGAPDLRPRRARRAGRRALGDADRMPQGISASGFRQAVIQPQSLTSWSRLFGRDNVYVELIDHGNPLDTDHNDTLAALAAERGCPIIATGNVHYAAPRNRHLATAIAAVRASRSLDELDGWLPAAGTAHLRCGREMRARFARYPGAVERTVTLADELAFPLRRAKPALPKQHVPEGHTPMSYLRQLVWDAVPRKYPDLDRGRPRAHRGRAAGDRDEGLPRLLPDRARHRRVRPVAGHPLPGARVGGQLGGLLPARTSPPSTRSSTSCRSSGSCRACATRSPTSTSTSTPTAARR